MEHDAADNGAELLLIPPSLSIKADDMAAVFACWSKIRVDLEKSRNLWISGVNISKYLANISNWLFSFYEGVLMMPFDCVCLILVDVMNKELWD